MLNRKERSRDSGWRAYAERQPLLSHTKNFMFTHPSSVARLPCRRETDVDRQVVVLVIYPPILEGASRCLPAHRCISLDKLLREGMHNHWMRFAFSSPHLFFRASIGCTAVVESSTESIEVPINYLFQGGAFRSSVLRYLLKYDTFLRLNPLHKGPRESKSLGYYIRLTSRFFRTTLPPCPRAVSVLDPDVYPAGLAAANVGSQRHSFLWRLHVSQALVSRTKLTRCRTCWHYYYHSFSRLLPAAAPAMLSRN